MNEVQICFVQYIEQYIRNLTKNRNEFFLSLCDIEEELLEELDISELDGYEVVVVGKNDYSEAVRLRNNIHIQKIVLLSGEGVKHIDSLKDFNEYSVLSENRTIIWECLEKVFSVRLSKEIKGFLTAILDQGEISLWELLLYLSKSMDKNVISPKGLNENLPMLGIWKSKEKNILKKGKINRLIRFSKYAVIEKRLTKAVMDRKITKTTWEKIITNSLSEGNVQRILEGIYFEDADAQGWLKSPGKVAVTDNSSEVNAATESWHGFSYEYKLKEQTEKTVLDIEEEWLQERHSDDTDLDWDHFRPLVEDIAIYQNQIENILMNIDKMILPDAEKKVLREKISDFWASFEDAWDNICKATPMCLNTFCIWAENYTKKYLELLAMILTEQRIRAAASGMDLVESIQTVFCEKKVDKIRMPYYHPICVFYYMCTRKMYENVLMNSYDGDVGKLKELIQAELIKKIGLQFPISIISLSGKEGTKYVLDHTTVWQSRAVEFVNIGAGLAYSVLDFKVVQKQILDYIYKHPFLSVITVALIDISDLEGIEQLAAKIRKLSSGGRCNVGRVDFLIISGKEEELKKKLSQIWETFEFKEMIRFRFGKNSYKGKNGYDLQRIIEDVDMAIIADSSVLYQEPRKERINKESNITLNRIGAMKLEEQIQNYFKNGSSDISIMWATLQQAAESREEGLWKWKSRELDNKTLSFCNQMVEEYQDKEIVALSSNKSILSEIFMPENMYAYRRKYNGKSITIISLDSCNKEERLQVNGQAQISYSLNSFYEAELDLQTISKELFTVISDVQLDFYYEDKLMHCNCSIQEEEVEEAEETDKDWEEKCGELLCWQMGDFLREDNILSNYFGELLLNQWYEKANSFPAVLMVERLSRGGTVKLHFDPRKMSTEDERMDSLEAITTHEMIRFVMNKEAIDEKTVSQFLSHYRKELLEKVLCCDEKYCLLREEEHEKLTKIQERIKES